MYLLLITRYIAKYHLVDLSLVKTGFKGQTEKSLRENRASSSKFRIKCTTLAHQLTFPWKSAVII